VRAKGGIPVSLSACATPRAMTTRSQRNSTSMRTEEHPDKDEIEHETDSVDSAEEALCEVLGLASLKHVRNAALAEEEQEQSTENNASAASAALPDLLAVSDSTIADIVARHQLRDTYQQTGVCTLPSSSSKRSLSVPAGLLRRLTEELVWDRDGERYPQVLRTYETVSEQHPQQQQHQQQQPRQQRVLTRLENLNAHPGWHKLGNDFLRRCVSAVVGQDMCLYKTKLNLKPAGGSGFAPHVDAPSLRACFGAQGPQNFVTVMVAIDAMTPENGCLRVADVPPPANNNGKRQQWNAETVPLINPDPDGNPDAGGRAGAIPLDVADDGARMHFRDLVCAEGGVITVFGGWIPHRSGWNRSFGPRRAVFFTYNPASEGDFHDLYYERMAQWRRAWRDKQQQQQAKATTGEYDDDKDALATIPRI